MLGSVVSTISMVGSGQFFTLRPAVGQEWVIHQIAHDNDALLQFFDGTNVITLNNFIGANLEQRLQLHVTNSIYYRLYQTSVNTSWFGFDGIQTNST